MRDKIGMAELEGRLLQCNGGFYYVEVAGAVYECRARGVFRKQGMSPLAGDLVHIEPQDDKVGTLTAVLPRKNALIRPAVANLDALVIVVAVADPRPNALIIDKMIAIAEDQEIEPIVVISKSDLQDAAEWERLYTAAGIATFVVTSTDPQTVEPLKRYIAGKTTAFTGNSGVGKSTILNMMEPAWDLMTGETSKKLGRGRHTTRTVTLYVWADGYIADTPGFSSLDMARIEIPREHLPFCFREFEPYLGGCQFTSCSHTKEKGCAILQAVADGEIAVSRHESFVAMTEEAKMRETW